MRQEGEEETQVETLRLALGVAGRKEHRGDPGGVMVMEEEETNRIKVGEEVELVERCTRHRCQTPRQPRSKALRHHLSYNHSPSLPRRTKGLCKEVGVVANHLPQPRTRTKAQAGPRDPFPVVLEEEQQNPVAGRNLALRQLVGRWRLMTGPQRGGTPTTTTSSLSTCGTRAAAMVVPTLASGPLCMARDSPHSSRGLQ